MMVLLAVFGVAILVLILSVVGAVMFGTSRKPGTKHQQPGPSFVQYMKTHPGSNGSRYKAVRNASDGLLYYIGDDVSSSHDILESLVEMNRRLTIFAKHHANNKNPYVQAVVKMVKARDEKKESFLCGAVANEAYSHAFGNKYVFLKREWATGSGNWDCGKSNFAQCFGIVLHEIGHLVCFSDTEVSVPVPCLTHGAGFCRIQAALHLAAKEAGVWSTKDATWEARLSRMVTANYAGDCMECCDSL
jgi:hypothetical protein